jgi:hypothetical protein
LIGPQAIFKPQILQLPISITTAPAGPYDDVFSASPMKNQATGLCRP